MSSRRGRNRPASSHRSNGHAGAPPDAAARFAQHLLAQIGRLDQTPATIAAMQRGLDDAWAVLDRVMPE